MSEVVEWVFFLLVRVMRWCKGRKGDGGWLAYLFVVLHVHTHTYLNVYTAKLGFR